MEQLLEAVILAGGDDDDLEYIIINDVLIDRDNVHPAIMFNLDEMSDERIKLNFRFERGHILRLGNLLRIPERLGCETGHNINALCIVLRRLAYPNRLHDLTSMFGLSAQSLSQIIKTTINIIIAERGVLLDNLNALTWLNEEKIRYYDQAVTGRGGAIPTCWGFIDGTATAMCRPTVHQELYYCGHKRYHCLKYQSVICPDGVIASLKGAYHERKHDAAIFRESRLYEQLEQVAVFGNDKFVLFGDQAYGLMELLLAPFRGRNEDLLDYQQQLNRSMKEPRLAVEWGFQKILTEFAFVDFRKNQKLLMQDLQAMYKVAVLLTNCHTWLFGSQTATYFNTDPPTLEEYFGE